MLSINPNRNVTRGFNRGTIINSNGNTRIVPLDFIDYVEARHRGDNASKLNLEYESFITKENFLVQNAIESNNKWESYSLIQDLSVRLNDFSLIDDLCENNFLLNCQTIDLHFNFSLTEKNFIFYLERIDLYVDARISIYVKSIDLTKELVDHINLTTNLVAVYCDFEFYPVEGLADKLFWKFRFKSDYNESLNCIVSLSPSNQLILESKSVNNYLYKRAHIDEFGNILRFENDDERFGKITDPNLLANLKSDRFAALWYVNKDKIDVCKVCEFRYSCVDFRIPSARDNDEWYHTIECDYNPYVAKWKNENGYISLCDSGVNVNSEKLTIDHDRVATINKRIWGD